MVRTLKFYADEHVDVAIARGLRRRGVDIVTVNELGLSGVEDEAHVERALADGRVIVTLDQDYLRIHSAGQFHGGVLFVRHDRRIGDVIRAIMRIWETMNPEDIAGHVEFI
ncbi:MAG: DUF5615 family PIN-like protein [Gemmataceae bacterium]|nr:DUF5615 family PIN-like protein [Gemmataceae bacterium]